MDETVSFTCPRCTMTSYNPNDVEQGYCGSCHDWTGNFRQVEFELWKKSSGTWWRLGELKKFLEENEVPDHAALNVDVNGDLVFWWGVGKK